MRHVLGGHALSPWGAPNVFLGQAFTRPGPIGEYFDVPNGAFPVPWGHEDCTNPDGCDQTLGQANGVTCEDTPEGGKRCSDGTYHPPGCPTSPGAPGTVQGAPPEGGFPIAPVAIAAGVVAGAALLLAGNRMGYVRFPEPYDKIQDQLTRIADSINAERAADAFNFSQYQAALGRKNDALFRQKDAEARLREQERIWEQAHRNLDALQGAQASVEALNTEVAAARAEADDYRAKVEQSAQNILSYRGNAEYYIGQLPEDLRTSGRQIIDPCFKGPSMRGPSKFEGILPDEYARRSALQSGIPARPIGRFY